ncbi:MAG: tetratricopeptide repeat protein [Polyangiales bacterium]
MSWSRHSTIVVVAVVGACALRADAAEPTDDDRAAAQEAFARGMERRAHGDLAGSLAAFKTAHERLPSPITGLELGRAYMLIGKLVAARRELDAVVRSAPKAGESATAKQARSEAADLLRDVSTRVPKVDVEISGARDAAVTIDGVEVAADAGGASHEVDPGSHRISATHDGLTSNRTVNVEEGDHRTVSFVFGPGEVSSHDVVQTESRRTPTWVYGSLVVGGVGVGVGAIAGIVALSDRSALGCSAGRCAGSPSDVDGLNRATTISTISFAVGLAGVGVGVYGLLTRSPTSETPKTASIEPWIGFGSLGLQGSF